MHNNYDIGHVYLISCLCALYCVWHNINMMYSICNYLCVHNQLATVLYTHCTMHCSMHCINIGRVNSVLYVNIYEGY